MTWIGLFDDYLIFFDDAIETLDNQEYDRLQEALDSKPEEEVPQQVIDDLLGIQKELNVLATKRDDLIRKIREVVIKGATETTE